MKVRRIATHGSGALVAAIFFVAGGNANARTRRPITAEDVATQAVTTSPDLEAKQAELAQAAAQVDQALVAFAPRFGLLARYTRLSDIDAPVLGVLPVAPTVPEGPIPPGTPLVNVATRFPVILNQGTFSATLSVPLSDYVFRLVQQQGAADGNVRAATVAREAARLRVKAEAKLAYYAFARAKLSIPLAEQAVAATYGHKEDVTHAFEAGQASRADVLRVESQLAESEHLLARTKNLANVAEAQIGTLLHEPVGAAYDVAEDLERSVDLDVLGSPASLVEEARSARLELRAIEESSRALDAQTSATKAGAYPRVDAFGDVTAANPNPRYVPQQSTFLTTWAVGAQLTWTPNDTFSALAQGRAVSAKKAQADADAKRLVDAIRIEVAQAVESVQNARSSLETSKRSLLAAEEGYRVRRALFQSGRATSVELTDAETELTRARLASLGAKIDARVASVRLRHATGRDRPNLSP